MASTSSIIQGSTITSSVLTSPKRNYYDVFVSYRGKDTRYTFIDHLFVALGSKGISAFKDDTKLKKGESIAPELFRAIEDSQVLVVVFSKNYASSTWCLRELECIIQCVQLFEKSVLPIFYDVDPSEVRHQKDIYGEAFSKHEEKFQHEPQTVQRWRDALTQVANLSGWDLCAKPQHIEIQKIVEEIIKILDYKFSSLPKDLVGMHSPIEELEKHLHLDSVDEVRVVGICGMGGIGKTTLARAFYNKNSHRFPAFCFIDDLSKIYRQDDGPISAQKQILHQTLGEEHLQMCNIWDASNLIRSRLHRVKCLIILDNVDQVEQLEKLALSREWLGAGSRIIIISRDEHILKVYGVDFVYKVPLLNETNSLQLFSRKAFKHDHIVSSYDKFASSIVWYANGLPLAIEVLGNFLFDRNVSEWESALARLRECPNKDIMNVLRLSFDGLEEMQKEIFLHIACFFNFGWKEYVKNVLNCCGFHADIGLKVLIDKSLISIVRHYFHMHSLFQKLGIQIVQENSINESRRWSMVWCHKQFNNVMLENMEMKVKSIVLDGGSYTSYQYNRRMGVIVKLISKLSHLRLLIMKNVNISGSLSSLSNELRYLEWLEYPFMDLPSSFQPNHLVELILKSSNIKQLWKGKKYLPKLKTLDLRYSKNLIKMPDFGEIPNIEKLNLEGCVKLVQIVSSIEIPRKLVFLNLKNCNNLASIPNNILAMSSLKDLCLSGCPKMFNNPRQLKKFDCSESSTVDFQSTTSSLSKWIMFHFHSSCPKGVSSCLLLSLHSSSFLHKLDISFCGLSQLPDAIGCLRWLEELSLGGNNFVTLPSLRKLSKLEYLNLEHCKLLETLPQLPFSIATEHMRKYLRKILIIFNCFKLGERGRCMAFSWMIQLIQANLQPSTTPFDGNIDIVLPGSELPIWFNNLKKNHDQIRMDLSPILNDNNVNPPIGLCCCIVLSIASVVPTFPTQTPGIRLDFLCSRTSTFYNHNYCPVIIKRDLMALKSYHMYLVYFSSNYFIDILNSIDKDQRPINGVRMQFKCYSGSGLNLQTWNYGYRWVYKQDLQLMHQSLNSFNSEVQTLKIEDVSQPQ